MQILDSTKDGMWTDDSANMSGTIYELKNLGLWIHEISIHGAFPKTDAGFIKVTTNGLFCILNGSGTVKVSNDSSMPLSSSKIVTFEVGDELAFDGDMALLFVSKTNMDFEKLVGIG